MPCTPSEQAWPDLHLPGHDHLDLIRDALEHDAQLLHLRQCRLGSVSSALSGCIESHVGRKTPCSIAQLKTAERALLRPACALEASRQHCWVLHSDEASRQPTSADCMLSKHFIEDSMLDTDLPTCARVQLFFQAWHISLTHSVVFVGCSKPRKVSNVWVAQGHFHSVDRRTLGADKRHGSAGVWQ